MKNLTLCGTAFAALMLVPSLAAQQANDVDPNGPIVQFPSRALGGLVAGSWSVEAVNPTTGFPDNRCLGVEAVALQNGDIKYYVSGGGSTSAGAWNFQIHRFDDMGNWEASFAQVTNAATWGARDMEAVGFTLYAGSDNAEVSEYAINPVTGDLTHSMIHNVPGVVGTVRALCTSDGGTTFYTKSFTSTFFEFTLAGGVSASSPSSTPSAYGFGWDDNCNTIWSSDTGSNLTEIDTSCVATGRTAPWAGTLGGATLAQGGVDVYVDSRNTGSAMSAVSLVQDTPDNITVYELEDCTISFSLSVTGCGSAQGQIDVVGATPNATAAIIADANNNPLVIPAGRPCAGTQVGISPVGAQAQILIVPTDANGEFHLTRPIPAAACGNFYAQAIDLSNCDTTSVVAL